MKITEIIWLSKISEKIQWKHNVAPYEVKEVIESSRQFRFVEKGFSKGEDVYAALGRTLAGRYLIIFFIFKNNHQALILSARDMTKAERKRYEKK